MQKEHNKIFPLTVRLRGLLAENGDAVRTVGEIDGEIAGAELSEYP